MCVIALYGPNCNTAQPVCMGSGSWTRVQRAILGQDCCWLCGDGLLGHVRVVVQQKMHFEYSQTMKEAGPYYCVTLRRYRYLCSHSSSCLLTPTARQQRKTSRSTTHAPENTGQTRIPLRPNLFCPWLMAPIRNWHHQGSSTPNSSTSYCAHQGRPQCSTSFSGQTPVVTTCEEG